MKTIYHGVHSDIQDCLYPTFKEWKQGDKDQKLPILFCLYPTFKEWKPGMIHSSRRLQSVYILPLRNENHLVRPSRPVSSFSFISYL